MDLLSLSLSCHSQSSKTILLTASYTSGTCIQRPEFQWLHCKTLAHARAAIYFFMKIIYKSSCQPAWRNCGETCGGKRHQLNMGGPLSSENGSWGRVFKVQGNFLLLFLSTNFVGASLRNPLYKGTRFVPQRAVVIFFCHFANHLSHRWEPHAIATTSHHMNHFYIATTSHHTLIHFRAFHLRLPGASHVLDEHDVLCHPNHPIFQT